MQACYFRIQKIINLRMDASWWGTNKTRLEHTNRLNLFIGSRCFTMNIARNVSWDHASKELFGPFASTSRTVASWRGVPSTADVSFEDSSVVPPTDSAVEVFCVSFSGGLLLSLGEGRSGGATMGSVSLGSSSSPSSALHASSSDSSSTPCICTNWNQLMCCRKWQPKNCRDDLKWGV